MPHPWLTIYSKCPTLGQEKLSNARQMPWGGRDDIMSGLQIDRAVTVKHARYSYVFHLFLIILLYM